MVDDSFQRDVAVICSLLFSEVSARHVRLFPSAALQTAPPSALVADRASALAAWFVARWAPADPG